MTGMRIELDSPLVEVGESVAGTLHWGPDAGTGPVRVGVGYRTEGRGTPVRSLVAAVDLTPSPDRTAAFELEIPSGGPISFDGRLIRVVWQVEARSDVDRAAEPDAEEEVTVFPRGGRTAWVRRMAPPPVGPWDLGRGAVEPGGQP